MLLALTLAGGDEGAANYIRLVYMYLDFAKRKKKRMRRRWRIVVKM